jgi:hypothetical protein
MFGGLISMLVQNTCLHLLQVLLTLPVVVLQAFMEREQVVVDMVMRVAGKTNMDKEDVEITEDMEVVEDKFMQIHTQDNSNVLSWKFRKRK